MPSNGHPIRRSLQGAVSHWAPMYRRILDAGKSLWIANARPDEVVPLLDAIGGHGVYLTVDVMSCDVMERLARVVEQYR